MILGDIILNKVGSGESLREAIAQAFGLKQAQVLIVSDISQLVQPPSMGVVCEQSVHEGEFGWRLTVYTYGLSTKPALQDIARQLVRELDAECLVPDDREQNPYTMILVTPQDTRTVSVDVARLDNYDEYWLA